MQLDKFKSISCKIRVLKKIIRKTTDEIEEVEFD